MTDATVESAREAIDEVDRRLLEAVNRRIELVRALHEHKVASGIPLKDPGREQTLLARLRAANPGPLSDDGLDRLYRFVLDLTRTEVHGD